jgi:hypothetical protein
MSIQNTHDSDHNRHRLPGISWFSWCITAAILCIVPAASILTSGFSITQYFEFPPYSLYVHHAPFSWLWWLFYAATGIFLSTAVGISLRPLLRAPHRPGRWSLLSFLTLCFTWAVAWNRWALFAEIQDHTFLLLWLSYIAFMNAVVWEVHGSCPLLLAPRAYLMSFPISGLFWWIFEFLNRFTQNWRYLNVEDFSPLSYTLFASCSFCTVLPSIWVTNEFFSRTILTSTVSSTSLRLGYPSGGFLITASVAALALLPLFPDYLFACIWVLPIALVLSCEGLIYKRGASISAIALWSVAGVWCGFVWELWNAHSVAKWIYLIPFVQRFHVFEMPIVGYAGYIPFGILCGMLIESLHKRTE